MEMTETQSKAGVVEKQGIKRAEIDRLEVVGEEQRQVWDLVCLML